MRVHAVQFDIRWEDKAANFATVRRLLSISPPSRGNLIVLPEMFATGFSRSLEATRQADPPETEQFARDLALSHGCFVVAGSVGKGTDSRGRNEAITFSPEGTLLGRFAKLHPVSYAGEHLVHEAGEAVIPFPLNGFIAATFVCYDLRFPEPFREAVRRGATMLIVIANWPVIRIEHWTALLKARAIENQAYVIGVNRIGSDPEWSYPGCSIIYDPWGNIVAEAGGDECVLQADANPALVTNWREQFPALRDAWWGGRLTE
jgi:omega-amidase